MRSFINGLRRFKRIVSVGLICGLIMSFNCVSVRGNTENEDDWKHATDNFKTYNVKTRDEFYTILFDVAATGVHTGVRIIAKGRLAERLEKDFDEYYYEDHNDLTIFTAEKYLKKYKNRQAFSFCDIATMGFSDVGLVDEDKNGRTNFFMFLFEDEIHPGKNFRKKYEKKMKKELLKLDLEDKTDVQRVRAVTDLICDKVDYGFAKGKYRNGPYSILKGKGVCENYSHMLISLLDAIGVECRYDAGNIPEGDHAWNIVKIHDKWYDTDVCWMDCGCDTYFLAGGKGDLFKYRNAHRISDICRKQYKICDTDCWDDGYTSPLRAWLIGINDKNIKTTVGKKIRFKKDRLKNVSSSNENIVEIRGNKLIAKKKGRVTITRTDGKYISQYYVLVR